MEYELSIERCRLSQVSGTESSRIRQRFVAAHHSAFPHEIVEGLGLLDAQHPERIPIKCLSFERAYDQRMGESSPNPHDCSEVGVATAEVALWSEFPETLALLLPDDIEVLASQPTCIKQAPQDDQGANSEGVRQTGQCVMQSFITLLDTSGAWSGQNPRSLESALQQIQGML